jgi:hypothetical protein
METAIGLFILAMLVVPWIIMWCYKSERDKYRNAFEWTYQELWKYRGRRFPDDAKLEQCLWRDLDMSTHDLLHVIEKDRSQCL